MVAAILTERPSYRAGIYVRRVEFRIGRLSGRLHANKLQWLCVVGLWVVVSHPLNQGWVGHFSPRLRDRGQCKVYCECAAVRSWPMNQLRLAGAMRSVSHARPLFATSIPTFSRV